MIILGAAFLLFIAFCVFMRSKSFLEMLMSFGIAFGGAALLLACIQGIIP